MHEEGAVNQRSGLKPDSQTTAENQWGWSGDEASNGPPATLSGAPAPRCPALSMLGVSLGHPAFIFFN